MDKIREVLTQFRINIGVWIAVFLVILSVIQLFGVRGYGEVEFVLSMIKILACMGFIILGIIINVGGVPTDNRGMYRLLLTPPRS